MKAIQKLVIVLACCFSSFYCSACDTQEKQDDYNECDLVLDPQCNNFADALSYHFLNCLFFADMEENKYQEKYDQTQEWVKMCQETRETACLPQEVYQNCINMSVDCDTEKNEIIIWGDCLTITGID